MNKQTIYFDDNDVVIQIPSRSIRRFTITENVKLNGIEYEIFKIEEGPGTGIRYTATRVLK